MSIFNFVETYTCIYTHTHIGTHTDMFFYSMGYNLQVLDCQLGFLQMLVSETTGL